MAVELKNVVHAAGSVAGGSGAVASGDGFSSARFGQGVYDLTLARPINEAECQILATRRGSALRTYFSIGQTSDTVKRVSVLDSAGAALDCDFDFVITRTGG